MAKKQLSTKEILAAARNQDLQGSGNKAADEDQTQQVSAQSSPELKPADKPTSTADILAAARAESGTGAESDAAAAKTQPVDKPADKPTSTADILAAARAESGTGAAKAPAKPATTKRAPTQKTSTHTSADKPSVKDMLKAVRENKPQPVAEQKAKPKSLDGRPKLPVKKAATAATSRRNFLVTMIATPFAFAWTSLTLTTGASLLGLARFMFPNVLVEPPMQFKIGPGSDYPLNTVSTKWKAERGIWLVHTDSYRGNDLIYALISVCTHLGCTPNWLEGETKFKCPCHGSGFYMNGINFEGPAPRPLERCGIRVAEDGMLEVDKSVKFQQELGQWEDPASFIDGSLV